VPVLAVAVGGCGRCAQQGHSGQGKEQQALHRVLGSDLRLSVAMLFTISATRDSTDSLTTPLLESYRCTHFGLHPRARDACCLAPTQTRTLFRQDGVGVGVSAHASRDRHVHRENLYGLQGTAGRVDFR